MSAELCTYDIRLRLLEDLHTGCGDGTVFVDRALARDSLGRAVINRTHIKGVWKDSALRLMHLGNLQKQDVHALFGRAGSRDDSGAMVCSSWRSDARGIVWESTARRPGSRAPQDETLRTVEFLPADTEVSGVVWIENASPSMISAFERVVDFTDRFGAGRTRGSGLVQVLACKPRARPDAAEAMPAAPVPTDGEPVTLRLALRNLDGLCIPSTGHPGNIISSFAHIPGRTLFGSLCQWALRRGVDTSRLFARQVHVGDALPLPDNVKLDSAGISKMALLPVPQNLRAERPPPAPRSEWPHWARADLHDASVAASRVRDEFDQNPIAADFQSAKRLPDNGYLFATDGKQWRFHRAVLELQMRNRRGDPLEFVSRQEPDLFSVEQLPADTCFLCDVQFPSAALADQFCQEFSALLAGNDILRVGRGGAPVVTEVITWMHEGLDGAHSDHARDECLQFTLTSDLVARSPTLGFQQALSGDLLQDLAGLNGISISKERAFSSSVSLRTFNYVSGLPSAPFIGIARGSAIRLWGSGIDQLRQRLQQLPSLGERRWEGCGRFVLDCYPLQPADSKVVDALTGELEATLEVADQIVRGISSKPSRSQLHQLRSAVFATPEDDAVANMLAAFSAQKDKKGGAKWQSLFPDDQSGGVTLAKALTDRAYEQRCTLVEAVVAGLSPRASR